MPWWEAHCTLQCIIFRSRQRMRKGRQRCQQVITDLAVQCCNASSRAYPQPCAEMPFANELEDDKAATLQYGHCPLSNLPYPQLPCANIFLNAQRVDEEARQTFGSKESFRGM